MSYSKIVLPDGRIDMPMEEDRVFHIIREADLLSSYNIARMIEYRLHRSDMNDTEIRADVNQLYRQRMARLVERGLFTTRAGRTIARALDIVGSVRLPLVETIDLHGNLDILRIVNYVSIHDLTDVLEEIYRGYDA